MEDANINNKEKKLVKRKLPRGTSEYQVCSSVEL
jgi:pre-rRNA-processing protein TSR1